MSAPKTQSRFVTVAEVAADLGVCRQTIRRWVQRGQFPPPLRVGGRRFLWLRKTVEAAVTEPAPERAAK